MPATFQSRHRSATLRVAARVADARRGERAVVVEIVAEQQRHHRSERWRWVWAAREHGRCFWHTAPSPRQAISLAVDAPLHTRARWLDDAVRAARALTRDR
jgi:hypothetical protein